MRISVLHAAELKLEEAVSWYRSRGEGLVERFLQEIAAARDLLLAHPHAWHQLGEGVRRIRLRRFPYGLSYVVEPEQILGSAIARHGRRPDYWRNRLAEQQK